MAFQIDVLTIFPELISSYASASLLGKAQAGGLLDLRVHDLRDGSSDAHRSVDDAPYGGGAGMVLMAEPIFKVVEAAKVPRPLFLLGPGGRRFDQAMAADLAKGSGFSLLCGRYEGVDDRVRRHLVDDEISIGDYVLAGGEAAALVIVEAVGRLVPGVMGNAASAAEESFSDDLLEYPQYTRPASLDSMAVPEVLLSGDHSLISRWRKAMALARTIEQRPDLIVRRGGITAEERAILADFDLGPYDGMPARAS